MDPATLAALTTVIGLFFGEAAKEAGKKLGGAAMEKSAQLIALVRNKFHDAGTEGILTRAEKEPTEKNIGKFTDELEEHLQDVEFAEKVRELSAGLEREGLTQEIFKNASFCSGLKVGDIVQRRQSGTSGKQSTPGNDEYPDNSTARSKYESALNLLEGEYNKINFNKCFLDIAIRLYFEREKTNRYVWEMATLERVKSKNYQRIEFLNQNLKQSSEIIELYYEFLRRNTSLFSLLYYRLKYLTRDKKDLISTCKDILEKSELEKLMTNLIKLEGLLFNVVYERDQVQKKIDKAADSNQTNDEKLQIQALRKLDSNYRYITQQIAKYVPREFIDRWYVGWREVDAYKDTKLWYWYQAPSDGSLWSIISAVAIFISLGLILPYIPKFWDGGFDSVDFFGLGISTTVPAGLLTLGTLNKSREQLNWIFTSIQTRKLLAGKFRLTSAFISFCSVFFFAMSLYFYCNGSKLIGSYYQGVAAQSEGRQNLVSAISEYKKVLSWDANNYTAAFKIADLNYQLNDIANFKEAGIYYSQYLSNNQSHGSEETEFRSERAALILSHIYNVSSQTSEKQQTPDEKKINSEAQKNLSTGYFNKSYLLLGQHLSPESGQKSEQSKPEPSCEIGTRELDTYALFFTFLKSDQNSKLLPQEEIHNFSNNITNKLARCTIKLGIDYERTMNYRLPNIYRFIRYFQLYYMDKRAADIIQEGSTCVRKEQNNKKKDKELIIERNRLILLSEKSKSFNIPGQTESQDYLDCSKIFGAGYDVGSYCQSNYSSTIESEVKDLYQKTLECYNKAIYGIIPTPDKHIYHIILAKAPKVYGSQSSEDAKPLGIELYVPMDIEGSDSEYVDDLIYKIFSKQDKIESENLPNEKIQ